MISFAQQVPFPPKCDRPTVPTYVGEIAKKLHVEVKAACTICAQLFLNNNIVAGMCGHAFHDTCIARWTKDHNACPTCRHPILGRTFPIFFDNMFTGPQIEEDCMKLETFLREVDEFVDRSVKTTEAAVQKLKAEVAAFEVEMETMHKMLQGKNLMIKGLKKSAADQLNRAKLVEEVSKLDLNQCGKEPAAEPSKTTDDDADGERSAMISKTAACEQSSTSAMKKVLEVPTIGTNSAAPSKNALKKLRRNARIAVVQH